jgi:hypothetical protein
MKFLTREEILAKTAREYDSINGIRVQSLTDAEVSSLRAGWSVRGEKNEEKTIAGMDRDILVLAIVDGNGVRVFKDGESALLESISGKITKPAAALARKLSGMSTEEVSDSEKNLEPILV